MKGQTGFTADCCWVRGDGWTPAQPCQGLCLPFHRATELGCAPGPPAVVSPKAQPGHLPGAAGTWRHPLHSQPSPQPVPAATASAASLLPEERQKNSLQNIFREPLQVIPSPPPAGPACLITLHDSVLNSSQAPRHTTPPDIYMKGVVLDASHPISKI